MRDSSPVTVRLLYLARLREAFASAGESIVLQGSPTVTSLVDALRARGGAFADELSGRRMIRVAINHAIANADDVIRDGDEVALLPPVTGG
ncbi:MAG TPA: MoaD/ThiS family protein [Casimicrobiaceae bacterium]|nr:MoaD/ThiS family protein [Casimicrobiaceae bacterium]